MEITYESHPSIHENLKSLFGAAADITTRPDDFCHPAFWQNYVRNRWAQVRRDYGTPTVAAMLGLTNGNLTDDEFSALLGHMSAHMRPGDIAIFSNNATGTIGDGPYNVQKERRLLKAAYTPPGILPYIHCIVDCSMRIGECELIDHRKTRAYADFNPQTEGIERKLLLTPPRRLRFKDLIGEVGGKEYSDCHNEILLPSSYQRSVRKMGELGRPHGLGVLDVYPDPTGQTRVSWIVMGPSPV